MPSVICQSYLVFIRDTSIRISKIVKQNRAVILVIGMLISPILTLR